MLNVFEIHEPATAAEASDMLGHFGPDAAVYAGGTELLVVMKEGLAHFSHLVNVKTVPGLDGIAVDEDARTLTVGPLVTHRQLERSSLVRGRLPLLAGLESQVANVRVRGTGTIGGNLCFAEPHSDPATLLLACGATLELTSAAGRREVPTEAFFVGLLETCRAHDEVLTRIRIPLPSPGARGAYERFSTHERPTATVAALLELDRGVVESARIVVGSVGAVPLHMIDAESLLRGARASEKAFVEAAELAARAVEPTEDPFESTDYKRQIVRVLVKRALTKAVRQREEGAHAA